ncbi:MAG: transcriptional repressor [Granulosicoccus sp.]|nr:transcriptional repressor [Granulosicoccus sp.]
MMPTAPKPAGFAGKHNHAKCITSALAAAEQCCTQNGTRFTALRRRVLELIWQGHQPVTAYALIKALRKEKENTEPPTVYRALEFLLQNNLIHRIESQNAYVGCEYPEKEHRSQFMICAHCEQATELENSIVIERAIASQASKLGFTVTSSTIEINGVCPACSTSK